MRYNAVIVVIAFALMGCGIAIQSIEKTLIDAQTQLEVAQKVGAEKFASAELEESQSLLAEAKTALANKDEQAQLLAQKAYNKARLAEAIARQVKAERESEQMANELRRAEIQAEQARISRQSAERELNQLNQRLGD